MFDINDVRTLRDKTGAGVLDCKKALEATNGDMDAAVDYLREKQILDIKGQINKIPNKISIVSVLFIVPLILLLVLGPYIINFIGR